MTKTWVSLLLFLCFCTCIQAQNTCASNYIQGPSFGIKFSECFKSDGGQWPMEVTEVRIGNALFNRNLGKSIFFVGEPVQVCMTGRFRQGFSAPLSGLQNSVHGTVLGGVINREFCDIDPVGCNGFQSGVSCNAGAVRANDNFCFCTYITEVEASPIDIDADVTWKILSGASNPSQCEKTFKIEDLLKIGKTPIACLKMDTKVKVSAPPFFTSRKSAILNQIASLGK